MRLTDITEELAGEDKFYLATVMDVYSIQIVNCAMTERMMANLRFDGLSGAFQVRYPHEQVKKRFRSSSA